MTTATVQMEEKYQMKGTHPLLSQISRKHCLFLSLPHQEPSLVPIIQSTVTLVGRFSFYRVLFCPLKILEFLLEYKDM